MACFKIAPLLLPSLRERPDDVQSLAQLFLERYARRYQRRLPPLEPWQLEQLRSYAWPGNIREIKSVMERTVILHNGGSLRFDLPTHRATGAPTAPDAAENSPWEDLPSMEELRRRYLRHVLSVTKGKIDGERGALRILGMKRSTLYAKIKKYGLDAVSQLYGK